MTNNLGELTPELWSSRLQRWIRKSTVYMVLATMEERKILSHGDTVHRPYTSDLSVADYTKGTAVTMKDLSATDEYLTVATTKVVPFYIDEIDKIQNLYSAADEWTRKAGYSLGNDIDGDFLEEAANASYSFDDSDVTATNGGAAGSAIIMSKTNAVEVVSLVKAEMNANSIPGDKAWDLIIDPVTASYIEQQVVANGFNTADLALKNGYAGDFMGFKTFVSNNLLHTTISTATGNVSADDTYTVGGVTFTFKAAPAVAGEVDLGADAATSLDNLAAAINGAAGAGTTYIEVSEANRTKLTNMRAAATETDTTLTVKTAGASKIVEALANVTTGDTIISCLAERRGSIEMVIQKQPTTQINKVADKLGYNFISFDLYGKKTFKEGADNMVEILIKA